MTVVALGTSQPQCVSPQGPIQGVSVSSQRKGEVDSIKKNMQYLCASLCVWNRIQHRLASTFCIHRIQISTFSARQLQQNFARGSATPPGLQNRERGVWLTTDMTVCFIMRVIKTKTFNTANEPPLSLWLGIVSCERLREDKLNLLT